MENIEPVTEEQKQKIIKSYPRKIKVNNINRTPFEHIYIADCEDGQYDLIRYSGFLPFLIKMEDYQDELKQWFDSYTLNNKI